MTIEKYLITVRGKDKEHNVDFTPSLQIPTLINKPHMGGPLQVHHHFLYFFPKTIFTYILNLNQNIWFFPDVSYYWNNVIQFLKLNHKLFTWSTCTCVCACISCYVSLLGLPEQSTTDWVAQIVDIYFHKVLEKIQRGPRSRCHGPVFQKSPSTEGGWPFSPCVSTWSSFCTPLCIKFLLRTVIKD